MCETNKTLIKFSNENSTVEEDTLGALAVQIGIIEILKAMEIDPDSICADQIGNIACLYYEKRLDLKKVLARVSQIDVSKNHLTVRNMKKSSSSIKNSHKYFIDLGCLSSNIQFLESIANLYFHGHNPQLSQLYPKVKYPVSRNTPMVSPLLKWNHIKDWKCYSFTDFEYQAKMYSKYVIQIDSEEWKYLKGHVINGKKT